MRSLIALSIPLSLSYSVEAYYCEFGFCEDDTYCCGTNTCCSNVYSVYYIWLGVLFVLLLLASTLGFFKYCCTLKSLMERIRSGRTPYTQVPSCNPCSRNLQEEDVDLEAGPLPTYAEATSLRK